MYITKIYNNKNDLILRLKCLEENGSPKVHGTDSSTSL